MNKKWSSFEDLLARASKGTDADWEFVDMNLGPEHLTPDHIEWAMKTGLNDSNDNVRDFSATIVAHSEVLLSKDDQSQLTALMTADEYEPVRHWLANALYKRRDRDPEVVETWEEACELDTPAGEFARSLK
jgi:hypothetical protein